MILYHVAIPTDVSLLSLSGGTFSSSSRRQSRAAGLQRMTRVIRNQRPKYIEPDKFQAPCSIFSENCYTVDLVYSNF